MEQRAADRKARRSEDWHRIQPAVTSVAAITATVPIAWYLLAVGAAGPNGRVYQDLVEHRVWSVLAAMSVVAWGLAVFRTGRIALRPLHGDSGEERVRGTDDERRERARYGTYLVILYLLLAGIVMLGVVTVARLTPNEAGTSELGRRATLLTVAGVVAAGAPIVGMWHSYARLRDLASALEGRGPEMTPQAFAGKLCEAWDDAQRCLGALAIVVGTGTVLTGALRMTLLAAGYPTTTVPASAVLAYGASFTVLSLFVYMPLYLAWRDRAERFTNQLFPLPEDARPSEDWVAGRTRLRALLGADTTLGKNLVAAAGILAPLATGVLTVFIPK
jgi:hypothetical protein